MPGHQVGQPQQGLDLPEAPRRPARGGGRRAPHARRRDRALAVPAQPARRARPADRRPHRGDRRRRRRPSWHALVRRCANFPDLSDELLTNVLDLLAGRYPSEEFSELRPRIVWDRVNDVDPRPRRLETAGGHQRRHDPRPRAVRRVPARRHPGRRARRGDGLREPAGRDVPARRLDVADRGHHVRAGHRHAGARPAGQDAVLARRPPGPPARARPGARRASCARSGRCPTTQARERLPRALRARRVRGGQRGAVPRRAGRGDRRRARRPHDRGRAVPRRDRRLAGVRAQPVRHPGARARGRWRSSGA